MNQHDRNLKKTGQTDPSPQSGDPLQQMQAEQRNRLQRVANYLKKAVNEQDDLQANMASVNAGLMRIGVILDDMLQEEMSDGQYFFENVPKLVRIIDTHVKVTRQVNKMTQTELAAAESRKDEDSTSPDFGLGGPQQ